MRPYGFETTSRLALQFLNFFEFFPEFSESENSGGGARERDDDGEEREEEADGGEPPIEGLRPVVEQLPPKLVLQRDLGGVRGTFGRGEGRDQGALLAGWRNPGRAGARRARPNGGRNRHGQRNGGDGEDAGRHAPNPAGGHAVSSSRASFRRDHGSGVTS